MHEKSSNYYSSNKLCYDHPKIIILPKGLKLNFDYKDCKLMYLDPKHFKSVWTYNFLMLDPEFYKHFTDYKHILIYQLDCLIFKDELSFWCDKNYSYIGAPFYRKNSKEIKLKAVGNGGFSLRKVEDFIKVLEDKKISLIPRTLLNAYYFLSYKPLFRLFKLKLLTQNKKPIFRNLKTFNRAEDEFWSYYAKQININFSIAPAKEAISFAIEGRPEEAMKLNNDQLPFGCHAWHIKRKKFWEQFL